MTEDLDRGEPDLLVFISSVMRPDLEEARIITRETFSQLPFTRPWAFEYTPARSDSADKNYLRKVQEADFVVWLIGATTTPPVVDEINTCIAAGRRLIAVKLPAATRDEMTLKLIETIQTYSKWGEIKQLDDLGSHLRTALSDEIVGAVRNIAGPNRSLKLQELLNLSKSRCQHMWIALGVSEDLAKEMAQDETVDRYVDISGPGLHVISGELGMGKTLAAERINQRKLNEALHDSSFPIPLFVQARALSEPIADYIDKLSQGFSQPMVHGVFLVVDGLDEVGVAKANSLLQEIRIYVGANDKAGAVVTTRKLPGLNLEEPTYSLPLLTDDEMFNLISKIADRELSSNIKYGWSPSIIDAAKRPLFAVLLGVNLRSETGQVINRPSELIDWLADQSLKDAVGQEQKTDQLLQFLAVKSVTLGRRVNESELNATRNEKRLLSESRLVNQDNGSFEFAVPIFREWFAARAVIEKVVSIESLISTGTGSDRWLYPLSIIASENEELGREVMKTLAEADCGFASLVLQESTDGWELTGSTSTPLTSALDIGREIHNSMGSWDIGLGAIFSEIGPKGKSDDLLTLGIRLNNRYITTSWYQGSDGLAPVVDLPSDFSMARAYQPDWQPWTHQELPESPLWPWLITKNELTRSLSKVLKSHELALISADGFDEWVWRFAQNAKGSGTLNPEPIDIQEILAVIASSGPNIVSTIIGNELYSKMQLDLLKSHFEALVIKGTHQIRDPWPTADLWNSPSGGGVWELYSKERLLDRTIAIYSAALKIYKSIVMRWFDTMRQRFLFNARLPATFIGRLEPGVKNIGPEVYPGLIMQTHSLKADEQSTIEFEIGARQEIHENWAIEWDQEIDSLRLLRPDKASWIYPLYQSTILDVFGSRPATKIAHEWLWRDLSRLGWVDSVG